MRLMHLLKKGACVARIGCHRPVEQSDTEIDIGQHAFGRAVRIPVTTGGEHLFRVGAPMSDGRSRARFLGRKMVEETAFGHARRVRQIINAHGGIALRADDIDRGGEQFAPAIRLCHRLTIPQSMFLHTGWYGCVKLAGGNWGIAR